jgi:hypothetical protein
MTPPSFAAISELISERISELISERMASWMVDRIPAGQGVVGGNGIAHLLDVAGRSNHPLAIEQGGHLLDAEAVLLDRQGSLDGVDAVFAAQARGRLAVLTGAPAAEGFGDGGNAVEQLWGG